MDNTICRRIYPGIDRNDQGRSAGNSCNDCTVGAAIWSIGAAPPNGFANDIGRCPGPLQRGNIPAPGIIFVLTYPLGLIIAVKSISTPGSANIESFKTAKSMVISRISIKNATAKIQSQLNGTGICWICRIAVIII